MDGKQLSIGVWGRTVDAGRSRQEGRREARGGLQAALRALDLVGRSKRASKDPRSAHPTGKGSRGHWRIRGAVTRYAAIREVHPRTAPVHPRSKYGSGNLIIELLDKES